MSKRTFQPSNTKRKRTHGFARECRLVRAARSSMHAAQRDVDASLPDSLKSRGLSKQLLVRKAGNLKEFTTRENDCTAKGFTLICCAGKKGGSRIGISVHGKIRGAVKRNRIKRIIRESFRLQRDLYPSDSDIVFAVRPDFDLGSPLAVGQAVGFVARRDTTP
jgi:ribonuclease P protein component